ncbi:MAG: hypothetical protein L6290_09255 [Thermodesulfovibrionales bacterium]|nr:hypothetical protein [Thermodesulfovibrionales bacterium]
MIIDCEDKIDCLVAKKDPIVIAMFQPKITLSLADELGPRYGASRTDACHKADLFLTLAKNNNASLIVFPEYSAPKELLFTLCKQPDKLLPGSLVVLPLEALSPEEYEQLVNSIISIDKCQCIPLDVSTRLNGDFVSICALIEITESNVRVYFQPKRFPSKFETSGLCSGHDYFCFRGKGISLTVLICADGNQPDIYEKQIKETLEAAPGRYFIHTQWNPEPRYPIYEEMWRRIISSQRDGSTFLISINVASDSSVDRISDTRVAVPYVSIACSGNGQPEKKYMSRRNFIAFKSLIEQERYGQVLNFIFPHDGAHIAEVKRPFESPTHAANITDTLLHRGKTFYFAENYIELDGKYANESIKTELEDRGISNKGEYFTEFTPEELEIFISSCLLQKKYTWLEHDILTRPLIWLSFYPRIVENQRAKDAVDYFLQCLDHMNTCEDQGYEPRSAPTIRDYPINLTHKGKHDIGWLFHCRGLSAERIAGKVRDLLVVYVQTAAKSRLRLFPINCSGDLRIDKIQMSSLSPIDSELLLRRNGMINDPLATLEIEIGTL